MRTRNSFVNFLANTGSYTINLILSFVTRTIFIHVFSAAYLGINGVFTNILSVLSLSELGIGVAMNYFLYTPIASEDKKTIRQFMNLYRVMYTVVGGFVGVAGLCLVPFLDFFLKDQPDIPGITFIYILYLANTVVSYMWGYKRAIIDGHQKSYIGTFYNTIFTTTQFILQIIVLLVFKNFILYLVIQIACSIATNFVVARKANKMYPYITEDRKDFPSKEVRKKVFKNVGAMSIHKLGDVVVNNTDNLIMSTAVGVTIVGMLSNYQMIQASIITALNGLFGAFTASIGNLTVEEDDESVFRVYKTLQFLCFWLYSFCSVGFMVVFTPFMEAWAAIAGKPSTELVIPMTMLLVFTANFYMGGMRRVILTFRDAMGLYWYDRYKPIFEVIINLVVSIVLVLKIGAIGVMIGTLVSTMTTCFWVEPLVTYKYGFHRKVRHYFGLFTKYTLTTIVVGGITYYLCHFIDMGGILEVVLKVLACTVIYNGIILLLYGRTEEFKILWFETTKLLKNWYNRRFKKNADEAVEGQAEDANPDVVEKIDDTEDKTTEDKE